MSGRKALEFPLPLPRRHRRVRTWPRTLFACRPPARPPMHSLPSAMEVTAIKGLRVEQGHWAIVLAAGSGTRLHGLTQDRFGMAVPKQFCSLSGGRTLLGDALDRARRVVPAEHVIVVVAAQHRLRSRRPLSPRRRGPNALLDLHLALERSLGPGAREQVALGVYLAPESARSPDRKAEPRRQSEEWNP